MTRCFLCAAPCGISTDEDGRPICADTDGCTRRQPQLAELFRMVFGAYVTKPTFHCIITGLADP